MKINKIKLENIRSYLNQEINLPEGTVLLSGDIGSGKSTILLATEFALFGLEKGMGQGLLRNGKDSGSVELYLDLDGKDVVIKRVLKRSDKSVKQDAGYILVDGKKEDGTATELKAKVLELLNYPKDYLTKGKGLLYKYTVYTPQEEMKRILLESKEDRLHVLRKIFDIDKYKRIQENCSLFLKHLRSESRVYDERLREYDIKLYEKENKEKELLNVRKDFEIIERNLDEIKIKTSHNKNRVEEFEYKIKEFNDLKNKFSLIQNNYENSLREKERNEIRLRNLNEEIKNFKEENFEEIRNNLQNKINIFQNSINEVESKLNEFRNKLSISNSKEENSKEIKDKIKNLEKCPTCFQYVNPEYKEGIFKEQDEKILEFRNEIEKLLQSEDEHTNLLYRNKEQVENLKNELRDIQVRKVKYENLLRKKEEILDLEKNSLELNEKISILFNEKNKLKEKIDLDLNIESEYRKIKLEYEDVLKKEREFEIKKTGVNEKVKFTNEIINRLNLEINKLNELKIKLNRIKDVETWLDKHFVNLMTTIEKNVMYKLHYDFNELFKKWFSIIIDNENLKVELDEEFTPKITQSDYDIIYTDLSGGEKTSVALAYRLSLNQILNNLSGEIKTKDLLILDEPTDGFSTEQLDRIRIVLDELNMKQIIIVSHEAKIESFVDKVLKFNKKDHISEVVQ